MATGENDDLIVMHAPTEDVDLGNETAAKKKNKADEGKKATDMDIHTLIDPEKDIRSEAKMAGSSEISHDDPVDNNGTDVSALMHDPVEPLTGAGASAPKKSKTPKKTKAKKHNYISQIEFGKIMSSGTTLDMMSDEQIARLSEEQFNQLLDQEKDKQEQLARERTVRARRQQQAMARERRLQEEAKTELQERKFELEMQAMQNNRRRIEQQVEHARENTRSVENTLFTFDTQESNRVRFHTPEPTAQAFPHDQTMGDSAGVLPPVRSESSPPKFQFTAPNTPMLGANRGRGTRRVASTWSRSDLGANAIDQSNDPGMTTSRVTLDTNPFGTQVFDRSVSDKKTLSDTVKQLTSDNLYDCSITGVKALQQHGLWLNSDTQPPNRDRHISGERGRTATRTPPYGLSKRPHGTDYAATYTRDRSGESKDEKIRSGITERQKHRSARSSHGRKRIWGSNLFKNHWASINSHMNTL